MQCRGSEIIVLLVPDPDQRGIFSLLNTTRMLFLKNKLKSKLTGNQTGTFFEILSIFQFLKMSEQSSLISELSDKPDLK
jgi:hypothetical protein